MKNIKVRQLTEVGVALALSVILNYIKLFKMPQGGSVSLEILPIIFIALRWGWKSGVLAGGLFGLLQAMLGGYVVHWVQLVLDYPLGFAVLGFSGIVTGLFKRNKKKKNILLLGGAIAFASALRLVVHTISGVVFFSEYAPEGMNPWIYSLSYNASYIVPQILISILVMDYLLRKISNREVLKMQKEI